MSNRQYVKLSKEYCTLDESTGIWRYKLPDDFTYSRSPGKKITVMNFMYYGTWVPRTDGLYSQIDYTTLHSPTLHDGNFNQDNYICTLCYTYNTVFKTFPIRSQPQYLEFYFKDTENKIVKQFYVPPGASGDDTRGFEQRFTIDIELVW